MTAPVHSYARKLLDAGRNLTLYGAWDEQFYPDGVGAWMTKLDAGPDGGLSFDERFFLEGGAFRGRRVHQVRLEGGDASSDSYCYSS